MTIADLISRLEEFDPELPVVICEQTPHIALTMLLDPVSGQLSLSLSPDYFIIAEEMQRKNLGKCPS